MSEQTAPADDQGHRLLALYDTALPQVYGYFLPRCGSPTTAEDLTAETFLAAVDAVKRRTVPDLTIAWLIGVARHKLVDHWRRVERDDRRLKAVASVAEEADDPWDEQIDSSIAHLVLDQLGANHRLVLTLRYLDGLPVPEVADHLGRTVAATDALLARAKAAFRLAYEPHRPDAPDAPGEEER